METVTIDDLKKLDIRIGKIETAEPVEGSEKLLKLDVDFGEEVGKRQILSGIAKFHAPEVLIGQEFLFIVNLEPRKMMGLESQGMLLATDADGDVVLISPRKEVPPGSTIR